MAAIHTTKDIVALVNDPNANSINLNIEQGHCSIRIRNEGVTHNAQLDYDECVTMGVMLIQMAAALRAQHAQAHAAQKQSRNGAPTLADIIRGAVKP